MIWRDPSDKYRLEEQVIKERMKLTGELFIDVGAFHGVYSINLSPYFKEVWAYEPNPLARKTLKQQCERLNIRNIKIFGEGLGDEKRRMTLWKRRPVGDKKYLGIAGFKQSYVRKRGRRSEIRFLKENLGEVEVITLAEAIGKRIVDFVKVDVEGFEKQVLLGAKSVMKQIKRWQIEVHDSDDLPYFVKRFVESGYQKIVINGFRNRGYPDYIYAARRNG